MMQPSGQIHRVVLYTRVSTQEQAERDLSLPAQRRSLREYCSARGYEIVKEFSEKGKSGRDDRRESFQSMMTFVRSPNCDVDAILVYQTSRFMRNLTTARVWIERLRKDGIRVVSISQETSDDAMGQLVQSFFQAIDQYESEVNGMRTRAALRENARRGYFNGAHPPFGFKVEKRKEGGRDRGRLVPNPRERELLLEVFHEYVRGRGAVRVADTLNRRGLTYRRNKAWTKNVVLKVIDEEAVVGVYHYGKNTEEPVTYQVEPIIPKELFELARRVRRERDPRRTPGRASSSPLLLSRIAKCGRCGRAYSRQSSGKRTKDGSMPYSYYNCRAYLRSGRSTCPGFAIPEERLDRAVLKYLSEQLFSEQRCRLLVAEVARHTGVLQQRHDLKRKAIKKQIVEIDRRLNRWYAAFEKGAMSEELGTDRVRELKAQKEILSAEIRELAPPPRVRADELSDEVIGRFRQRLQEALLDGDRGLARRYLRELVERVEVTPERVTVVARPLSAAMMMASETTNAPGGLTTRSEVLTCGPDWLRRTDLNRRPGG